MNKTHGYECNQHTRDDDSTYSIYDDVLFSHSTISSDPCFDENTEFFNKRRLTNKIVNIGNERHNNSMHSIDTNIFRKDCETSSCMSDVNTRKSYKWESFQTSINLDEHGCEHYSSQLKCRKYESFRTGLASYDTRDLLSLEGSFDDDLSLDSLSKVDELGHVPLCDTREGPTSQVTLDLPYLIEIPLNIHSTTVHEKEISCHNDEIPSDRNKTNDRPSEDKFEYYIKEMKLS